MLRWYPPAWRVRYGDEMTALMEDSYESPRHVPARERLNLVRSGLAERGRAIGIDGFSPSPADRVRDGSILVLCGWGLFLIAGGGFGKFTDRWQAGTPKSASWLAGVGFDTALVMGVAGCALVVVAAVLIGPSFARHVRDGDGNGFGGRSGAPSRRSRRPSSSWQAWLAGHTNSTPATATGASRSTAQPSSSRAWSSSEPSVWPRRQRSPWPAGPRSASRTLRLLGVLAIVLTAVMALLLAGMAAWWGAEAAGAPQVVLDGIGNGVPYLSSTLPPTLLGAGLLMLVGLVLGAAGSIRVAQSLSGLCRLD